MNVCRQWTENAFMVWLSDRIAWNHAASPLSNDTKTAKIWPQTLRAGENLHSPRHAKKVRFYYHIDVHFFCSDMLVLVLWELRMWRIKASQLLLLTSTINTLVTSSCISDDLACSVPSWPVLLTGTNYEIVPHYNVMLKKEPIYLGAI